MVGVWRSVRAVAVFTSLSTTMKLLVWLNGGEPLSLTRTVIKLVLGPWASVGVQVNTPVVGLRFAPAGALTRPKVNVLAGMSESAAVLVTLNVLNSAIV